MATVPVTRTWVPGEVVTAPHFNDNIRDVLLYLLAKPIVQCRQTTTAQTLTNNTWTNITFNTEDVDSSGMHSTSSNTDRFVAVYPGWYRFSGAPSFASNATSYRGARWAKNGTAIDSANIIQAAVAAITAVHALSVLIFLPVGEYATLQALQNSGGNLDTSVVSSAQSTVNGEWVSN